MVKSPDPSMIWEGAYAFGTPQVAYIACHGINFDRSKCLAVLEVHPKKGT